MLNLMAHEVTSKI